MKIFHAVILAAFVSIIGIVATNLPEIIQNSEFAIKDLYREAVAGRFQTDLSREWPPIEAAWPAFLRRNGERIINEVYAANEGMEGYRETDRAHLVSRARGEVSTGYQIPPQSIVGIQAYRRLVMEFAEAQAAARRAGGAAGASTSRASAGNGHA